MNENNPYILIADAHLADDDSCPDFFEMLGMISETAYNVIFMGDIFELWIAYDPYETDVHRRFLAWCREEKKKRIIGYIEGNHEFYVTTRYADAFSWGTDRSRMIANDKLCLMHGDTINEADYGYRLLRLILRNPFSRLLVWAVGPVAGKLLSEKIRLSLKNKNMKHKKEFPEKYFCRLADKLENKQVPLCLMGHFHQTAALRGINVLPAWEPDGEVGVYLPATGRFRIAEWKSLLKQEVHK